MITNSKFTLIDHPDAIACVDLSGINPSYPSWDAGYRISTSQYGDDLLTIMVKCRPINAMHIVSKKDPSAMISSGDLQIDSLKATHNQPKSFWDKLKECRKILRGIDDSHTFTITIKK